MTTIIDTTTETTTNGQPEKRSRRSAQPAVPTEFDDYVTRAKELRAEIEAKKAYHRNELSKLDTALAELGGLTTQPHPTGMLAATAPEAPKPARKPRSTAKSDKPRAERGSKIKAAAIVLDEVIGLLTTKKPESMRSEAIREELGCDAGILAIALKTGVKEGNLIVTGVKRASAYSLPE